MTLGIFAEISLIIVLAVIICSIIKILRQPLIIGYILTGLLVSPILLNIIKSTEELTTFSQIGIALLLFIVGIGLSPRTLKEVGWISLATGLGQVIFTAAIGFLISLILGFNVIASIYIAIALTFSSTIIIMKLLSDKNALDTLYGKISIGLLIVQDLIAIFLLIIISTFSQGASIPTLITQLAIKGFGLISLLFIVSYLLIPRLKKFIGNSQEYLFIFSIAWCLAWASLFNSAGFSIEIGALLAGVSLSMSPLHFEISSRVRPLRDFFLVIFFILLGAQMTLGNITKEIVPATILSLFVLIGNPLIVMTIMGIFGYTKRNGFMVGLTVAQISEFSLIIIALGARIGHINQEIVSFVTIIGLFTIAGSTYMIIYAERIYNFLAPYMQIFERKGKKIDDYKSLKEYDYNVILWGYNRIGFDLLMALKKTKEKFVVIDFNPDTIIKLNQEKIPCRYGDASDIGLLEAINISRIKMVVSTIPDYSINKFLIEYTNKKNKKAIIIVVSHDLDETAKLYSAGATYVLMPHFLGGHHVAKMIERHGMNINQYKKEKLEHLKILDLRKKRGHAHPQNERHRS